MKLIVTLAFLVVACNIKKPGDQTLGKLDDNNRQMLDESNQLVKEDTVSKKVAKIDTKDLQGIWFESKDENALFTIQGDSIYYLEDTVGPYFYEVINAELIVHYSKHNVITTPIIFLNKDSLILDTYGEKSLLLKGPF